jgi:hypothetical protein
MEKTKLTIDGVEYTLEYDFNRICDAEEAAGTNLLIALERLLKLSAKQLRGLLFAAMERDGARLTLAEVGKLIRIDTVGTLTSALADAYRASLPAREPKTE